MTPEDAQDFFDTWDQCAELYGKPVSRDAKELAFKLLVKYPLGSIKAALQAHMLDPEGGRFMVKPADVVRKIHAISPSGFPGAEQAWAEFPRDESQSACICNEMAKAWGIACELDEISGRMAFKEAYSREVELSKAKGNQPVWFISAGSDKQQIEQITLDAVRDRLISPAAAKVYLPHISENELAQLSVGQTTANKLLEAHAATIGSVDQLLLAAPKEASLESSKAHLSEINKLLGIKP